METIISYQIEKNWCRCLSLDSHDKIMTNTACQNLSQFERYRSSHIRLNLLWQKHCLCQLAAQRQLSFFSFFWDLVVFFPFLCLINVPPNRCHLIRFNFKFQFLRGTFSYLIITGKSATQNKHIQNNPSTLKDVSL